MILSLVACKSYSDKYAEHPINSYLVGQFNDSVFSQIKTTLDSKINKNIKDTIYIKYEYSIKSCWDILDTKSENHILASVFSSNQFYHKQRQAHPMSTILRIREDDNNFNQYILLNDQILVDVDNTLKNLLNIKPHSCGNGIMIMPDGKYIVKTNDSHAKILELTEDKLKKLIDELNKI